MKRTTYMLALLGLIEVSALSLGAQLAEKPPTVPQLNARIAQLEEQVRQINAQATVCQANLLLAQEPQRQKDAQTRFEALGKDMGCVAGVNWAVAPPICNPEPPKAEKSSAKAQP